MGEQGARAKLEGEPEAPITRGINGIQPIPWRLTTAANGRPDGTGPCSSGPNSAGPDSTRTGDTPDPEDLASQGVREGARMGSRVPLGTVCSQARLDVAAVTIPATTEAAAFLVFSSVHEIERVQSSLFSPPIPCRTAGAIQMGSTKAFAVVSQAMRKPTAFP